MILHKQLGVFLNLVHNRFKQYLTEMFESKGYNISPEQFLVLDTLWDEGILSQQEIANIILKDKNSVVKLVDGLEERKLVRRVRDKNDRRQNFIEVTPQAKKIKEDVTQIAMEAVNNITKGIDQEILNNFVIVLARMGENMSSNLNLLEMAKKYPSNKRLKNRV